MKILYEKRCEPVVSGTPRLMGYDGLFKINDRIYKLNIYYDHSVLIDTYSICDIIRRSHKKEDISNEIQFYLNLLTSMEK